MVSKSTDHQRYKTGHSVSLQAAYILHIRKYRETSIIADIFTEDFGVLSVLAKGVRKQKSKLACVLRLFTPLQLSYTGKSDLKTLTAAEIIIPSAELRGRALYCGFYINELIKYFLHKDDAQPEIFQHYRHCLEQLAKAQELETALRLFELELLENIGYGLQLEHEGITGLNIDQHKLYRYQQDLGPIEAADGFIRGETLQALNNKQLQDQQTHREAKRLMRQQIDFHLQGRELKSRSLIKKLSGSQ